MPAFLCDVLLIVSLLIPRLVCLLRSGFHFGKSAFKKRSRWDVWTFTARWRYLGVGVCCFVLLMWLFCIWSVGYAPLPVIQRFNPFHPGSPSDSSRLLYSSSVSKRHNQLSYSHSGLRGMFSFQAFMQTMQMLFYNAINEIHLSYSCIQYFFMWGKCDGWLEFAMLRALLWGWNGFLIGLLSFLQDPCLTYSSPSSWSLTLQGLKRAWCCHLLCLGWLEWI